jgi:hypothetical protein
MGPSCVPLHLGVHGSWSNSYVAGPPKEAELKALAALAAAGGGTSLNGGGAVQVESIQFTRSLKGARLVSQPSPLEPISSEKTGFKVCFFKCNLYRYTAARRGPTRTSPQRSRAHRLRRWGPTPYKLHPVDPP